MPKTLEEVIGCWTVNPQFNSLPRMANRVKVCTTRCSRATRAGSPRELKDELRVLKMQLSSMLKLATEADKRLDEIILKHELSKPE